MYILGEEREEEKEEGVVVCADDFEQGRAKGPAITLGTTYTDCICGAACQISAMHVAVWGTFGDMEKLTTNEHSRSSVWVCQFPEKLNPTSSSFTQKFLHSKVFLVTCMDHPLVYERGCNSLSRRGIWMLACTKFLHRKLIADLLVD